MVGVAASKPPLSPSKFNTAITDQLNWSYSLDRILDQQNILGRRYTVTSGFKGTINSISSSLLIKM